MADNPPAPAHQFQDLQQQRAAAELGMWLFLATEFMFFGGLFLAYFVYRGWYTTQFMLGSQTMNRLLGTVNTAALLASSVTMALAVHAARESRQKALIVRLLMTASLGALFLIIKGYEYYHKYEEQLIPFAGQPFQYTGDQFVGMSTFFNLYFVMTGLHAFHMVIGIVLLLVLTVLASRGGLLAERAVAVHNAGLYWHFVDLVWVYLFPFFYLVSARSGTHAAVLIH